MAANSANGAFAMSRRPCLFRETDLSRAIRAVLAAGLNVARAEITKDGVISVVPGKPPEIAPPDAPTAHDEWTV
jgi:hypothetical protein